jgi:purine-binding chemotaxis protein CheW
VPGDSLQILVFDVGGRHYGLPVSEVRELLRAVTIVELPHAPSAVEGVINLRGAIVPVLDIRSRFGLPAKPLEYTDHFIVAQAGERLVALRADRALVLVHLSADDVEDARALVPGIEEVAQVARLRGDLVLIPDLRALLAGVGALGLDTPATAASQKGGSP